MREGETRGVEEHALQAELAQLPIEREIAVFLVAEHRMAQVREVHADLVRAAGEELGFEEAETLAARKAPQQRLGLLAFLRHRDVLARGRAPLRERETHALALVAEAPRHRGDVALVHLAVAQHAMQLREGRTLLREQEDPRGLAVEAMHELEE